MLAGVLQGGTGGPLGQPRSLLPLFSGGTFDAHFNRDSQGRSLRFRTPNGTRAAVLQAVITGAPAQCRNLPLVPLTAVHAATRALSCTTALGCFLVISADCLCHAAEASMQLLQATAAMRTTAPSFV